MSSSRTGFNGFVFGDGVLGSSNPETVASDTFVHMHQAFSYLHLRHGRTGLDGNNGPAVRGVVRHTSWPSNWWPPDRAILIAAPVPGHHDQGSIDIVAHEIGHGLSDFGPNLVFGTGLESGAIAESTANMFALLVSSFHAGFDLKPYRIGEETSNPTDTETFALTYMDDPALKSGTVACYSSSIASLEPHRAAGPGDHMFFLLVYGGTSKCNGNTVTAVGRDAAEKIWFAAFYALPSTATYAQLRARFVDAAVNLFGTTSVVASTTAAFDAVAIP